MRKRKLSDGFFCPLLSQKIVMILSPSKIRLALNCNHFMLPLTVKEGTGKTPSFFLRIIFHKSPKIFKKFFKNSGSIMFNVFNHWRRKTFSRSMLPLVIFKGSIKDTCSNLRITDLIFQQEGSEKMPHAELGKAKPSPFRHRFARGGRNKD